MTNDGRGHCTLAVHASGGLGMEAPEHAVSFPYMGASVLEGMLQEFALAELCGESSLLDGAAQTFTCKICNLRVRHSDGPRHSRLRSYFGVCLFGPPSLRRPSRRCTRRRSASGRGILAIVVLAGHRESDPSEARTLATGLELPSTFSRLEWLQARMIPDDQSRVIVNLGFSFFIICAWLRAQVIADCQC